MSDVNGKICVILADDHPVVRDGLAAIVNQQPDMQVVAQAGDGDEDICRSLSQGAKGYLLKDAPRQEILSAIRAVSADQPYTSSSLAAKAIRRMALPSPMQLKSILTKLDAIGCTEAVAVVHQRGLVHL